MFFCKPDMTPSWFLSLGALQMIIHDGFWKSEHDFLILIYSNFLFVMHGFRDNEVLLQAGYDVIVISPLGGASYKFSWRIRVLGMMLNCIHTEWCPGHEVKLLPHIHYHWQLFVLMCHEAGQSAFLRIHSCNYVQILIISYLATFLALIAFLCWCAVKQSINQSINSWRILIERAWLLMTFYKNFLSRMNDFRDNEVLLQARYDVTMISSLGGASGEFSWRILKERLWLPDSVPK